MSNGSAGAPGPVVALVLASGGLKPLSAIPLLEFLDREGIREDLLVGCSGGGLVAALRSEGRSCTDIRDRVRDGLAQGMFRKDWRSMLGALRLPGGRYTKSSGLFKPDCFRSYLREVFGERRIEDLPAKLLLQATDYDTGDGVVLSRGKLADAVYVTAAVPPFFPPVQMDGRWLFDGCYSAPVPVMQAVHYPADVIIVLEVQERLQGPESGFFESIFHLNKILTQAIMRNQMTLSVMMHHYEIVYVKVRFDKYIQIWDVDALPRIYEAGEAAVAKYGEEIRHVIRGFHPDSHSTRACVS